MTNFKYKLAYKCKNQEEATTLVAKLNELGYEIHSSTAYNTYSSNCCYLSTKWNSDINGLGFGSAKYDRELIDNSDLFLALAAMRDSEEFFIGELFTGTSGWFNSMKDHARYSRKDVYTVKNYKGQFLYSQEGDGCNCTMSNARKLTKEEIIDLFSKKKEVTIKEDNKVYKHSLRLIGSKAVKEAIAKELIELGYKDVTYPISSASKCLVTYTSGVFQYLNHEGGDEDTIELDLGTSYSKALELAAELVEKELVFEVGKWYKRKDTTDCILCYEGYGRGFGIWSGTWGEGFSISVTTHYVLATKKEIEQALIIGAKAKGFKEGVKFKDAESGTESTVCRDIESATYYTRGVLQCGSTIYYNGKWATIISSHPTITVDEYTCEFHNNYVQFGCQRINAEDVRDLYIALESFNTERENYNDDVYSIMSITILKDLTISLKDIKQIVDYYQKKK